MRAGSSRMSSIHARLVADQADLHQLADHPRGADLGDDVPARLGVDDDEVVVPLAHLVASLPTARISFTPGAASATKSNVRASGPMRPTSGTLTNSRRYSRSESSVFIAMREQAAVDLPRLERERRRVERGGERALGVHLADQRALAAAGGEVGERGGDRGLADATLAGDEQQLAVEQVAPSREVHWPAQPPKPMRRSPSCVPTST